MDTLTMLAIETYHRYERECEQVEVTHRWLAKLVRALSAEQLVEYAAATDTLEMAQRYRASNSDSNPTSRTDRPQ